MKYLLLYIFALFVGLPLVMTTAHIATLPEDKKQGLVEAGKLLNGRIYEASISCSAYNDEHIMRVHGLNRDDALEKLQNRLPRCEIEILEGESDPIWKEAIRSVLKDGTTLDRTSERTP